MRSARSKAGRRACVATLSAAVIAITSCAEDDSGQAPVEDPTGTNFTGTNSADNGSASTNSTTADDSPPISSETTGELSPSDPATDAAQVCWSTPPVDGTDEISFVDATDDYGLVEPLTGMYGHAIAAGDPNGDGWTDLFVGTFADRPDEDYQVRGADGPSPDRLLLGGPDGFTVDESFPGQFARSSGATFADLDGDGDLDLIVSRNPRGDGEIGGRPTTIFERDGDGWQISTALADDVGGRSVAAVDFDRDGLLDLAVAGDRFGAGPTRIYRNVGGMEFEDTTDAWGIPRDVETLALSTIDLDGDGWIDIVFSGDTRVLMGRGPGEFEMVEVPVLEWDLYGDEDDPAGIAVGDLDNDGRPDLVIGQHFNSTLDFGEQVPVRIFLNRSEPGDLELIDVTDQAGSPPLPTKSPHVAIADLDNDGLQDIVTSAITEDGAALVLTNRGSDGDIPRFDAGGTASDSYYVTGVTEDLDRDGRADVVAIAWEPTTPSIGLRNSSATGGSVLVDTTSLGSDAESATVRSDSGATNWFSSNTGYAAGASPIVHVGVGDATNVTVSIESLQGNELTCSASSQ